MTKTFPTIFCLKGTLYGWGVGFFNFTLSFYTKIYFLLRIQVIIKQFILGMVVHFNSFEYECTMYFLF